MVSLQVRRVGLVGMVGLIGPVGELLRDICGMEPPRPPLPQARKRPPPTCAGGGWGAAGSGVGDTPRSTRVSRYRRRCRPGLQRRKASAGSPFDKGPNREQQHPSRNCAPRSSLYGSLHNLEAEQRSPHRPKTMWAQGLLHDPIADNHPIPVPSRVSRPLLTGGK